MYLNSALYLVMKHWGVVKWPKTTAFEAVIFVGSNPTSPAKQPRLAQPGGATALGAEGCKFKSYISDHFFVAQPKEIQ